MILMYHKINLDSPTLWWVAVDSFYRQMCELKCRKVVYLDEYDPADSEQVVITFDGIYKNVLEFAAPILSKFRYPFELFVTSDYIGKDNSFDTPEPHADFASAEELQKLIACGGRLQWHTRSHANLQSIADGSHMRQELTVPEELRSLDKEGFTWFAYPHGDFNKVVVTQVRQLFKGAVSCNQGSDHDSFLFNRLTVTNETSFKKATIGVLIASYNYGAFLVEAVESVLRQTRPVDEIVIADDCSSDNTMEIAQEYQKRYPQLISCFRNEQNLGIVKNFNKAMAESSADYICFLGADNRFRSDYIEKTAQILDSKPMIAVAYTDFAMFGVRAKIEYERLPKEWQGGMKECYYLINFPDFTDESRQLFTYRNFMHGSSLYRRKAFNDVGGYKDEQEMPEDHNLFFRMIKHGWGAKRAPWPLLEYRQHSREQVNVALGSYLELHFYKGQCKKLLKENEQLREQYEQFLQKISSLQRVITEKDSSIDALHTSLSWRATSLLRKIHSLITRFKFDKS